MALTSITSMASIWPVPKTAFAPFSELIAAIGLGLWPTLLAIWADRSLVSGLYRRQARARLSRVFFYHVWRGGLAKQADAAAREVKEDLIRRRARGVVLEMGAGFGHTLQYLDRDRVSMYIACEPNKAMHRAIRARALKAGFADEQLLILQYSATDLDSLLQLNHPRLQPGSVDTLISILTLCSVLSPNTAQNSAPHRAISEVIRTLLKPKTGTMLFYEHMRSPTSACVRAWQWLWTPIWSVFFDGCRLDIPTSKILVGLGGWSSVSIWDKPNEDPENLFYHQAGELTKA